MISITSFESYEKIPESESQLLELNKKFNRECLNFCHHMWSGVKDHPHYPLMAERIINAFPKALTEKNLDGLSSIIQEVIQTRSLFDALNSDIQLCQKLAQELKLSPTEIQSRLLSSLCQSKIEDLQNLSVRLSLRGCELQKSEVATPSMDFKNDLFHELANSLEKTEDLNERKEDFQEILQLFKIGTIAEAKDWIKILGVFSRSSSDELKEKAWNEWFAWADQHVDKAVEFINGMNKTLIRDFYFHRNMKNFLEKLLQNPQVKEPIEIYLKLLSLSKNSLTKNMPFEAVPFLKKVWEIHEKMIQKLPKDQPCLREQGLRLLERSLQHSDEVFFDEELLNDYCFYVKEWLLLDSKEIGPLDESALKLLSLQKKYWCKNALSLSRALREKFPVSVFKVAKCLKDTNNVQALSEMQECIRQGLSLVEAAKDNLTRFASLLSQLLPQFDVDSLLLLRRIIEHHQPKINQAILPVIDGLIHRLLACHCDGQDGMTKTIEFFCQIYPHKNIDLETRIIEAFGLFLKSNPNSKDITIILNLLSTKFKKDREFLFYLLLSMTHIGNENQAPDNPIRHLILWFFKEHQKIFEFGQCCDFFNIYLAPCLQSEKILDDECLKIFTLSKFIDNKILAKKNIIENADLFKKMRNHFSNFNEDQFVLLISRIIERNLDRVNTSLEIKLLDRARSLTLWGYAARAKGFLENRFLEVSEKAFNCLVRLFMALDPKNTEDHSFQEQYHRVFLDTFRAHLIGRFESPDRLDDRLLKFYRTLRAKNKKALEEQEFFYNECLISIFCDISKVLIARGSLSEDEKKELLEDTLQTVLLHAKGFKFDFKFFIQLIQTAYGKQDADAAIDLIDHLIMDLNSKDSVNHELIFIAINFMDDVSEKKPPEIAIAYYKKLLATVQKFQVLEIPISKYLHRLLVSIYFAFLEPKIKISEHLRGKSDEEIMEIAPSQGMRSAPNNFSEPTKSLCQEIIEVYIKEVQGQISLEKVEESIDKIVAWMPFVMTRDTIDEIQERLGRNLD